MTATVLVDKVKVISKILIRVVKGKCQYGHVNLIPVTEVFHVYENIKCEKCGKVIAEPNARAFE